MSSFIVYGSRDGDVPQPLFLKTDVNDTGIVVNNQQSAWSRRFGVEMKAKDVGTGQLMKNIQAANGWGDQFQLRMRPAGMGVEFLAAGDETLPEGEYGFWMHIDGYRRSGGNVIVKSNETAQLTIDLELDEKRRVVADIENSDPQIKQALENSTGIDGGLPAIAWLGFPDRDERRKACLLNVLAKLRPSKVFPS